MWRGAGGGAEEGLLHSFGGGGEGWPAGPLVVACGEATLRLQTHLPRGDVSGSAAGCWGFACEVRGFDPSFGASLPLPLDCEKGIALLAARCARVVPCCVVRVVCVGPGVRGGVLGGSAPPEPCPCTVSA